MYSEILNFWIPGASPSVSKINVFVDALAELIVHHFGSFPEVQNRVTMSPEPTMGTEQVKNCEDAYFIGLADVKHTSSLPKSAQISQIW